MDINKDTYTHNDVLPRGRSKSFSLRIKYENNEIQYVLTFIEKLPIEGEG
jgi:hypothetical protein